MRKAPRLLAGILAATAIAAPLAGLTEEDPIFDFIPAGGRTLLADVIGAGLPADELSAILSGEKGRDDWLSYLEARSAAIPGLAALDEYQMLTLADYLSFNVPLETLPPGTAGTDWQTVLPRDGRDLTMEYCQSCHIITVVITQDRARDAWLGTLNKPSHIEIDLTQEEREALANYLVINAAIPIDQVPPPLRAGGATY